MYSCSSILVAERKRADKNGNHNAQFTTETSVSIETLMKNFNVINNTKLDEEYKVC